MDRVSRIFVDGMGAAAATSGVLTELQGRIFAHLYLEEGPVSLDDITDALQQSKSNVSVQIRGLLEWQLVRRVRIPGSRKDHYEAATDFWRVMQEILQRRFRWNLRLVLAAADEAERALRGAATPRARRKDVRGDHSRLIQERLTVLREYFIAVDAGLGAFCRGEPMTPGTMRESVLTRVPVEEAKRGRAKSPKRSAARQQRLTG
jgi:DNA-binding transcriptional regulator GbsR (MarR family)